MGLWRFAAIRVIPSSPFSGIVNTSDQPSSIMLQSVFEMSIDCVYINGL